MDTTKTTKNFLWKFFLHRGIEVEQLSPPQSIPEHLTSLGNAQISRVASDTEHPTKDTRHHTLPEETSKVQR